MLVGLCFLLEGRVSIIMDLIHWWWFFFKMLWEEDIPCFSLCRYMGILMRVCCWRFLSGCCFFLGVLE